MNKRIRRDVRKKGDDEVTAGRILGENSDVSGIRK